MCGARSCEKSRARPASTSVVRRWQCRPPSASCAAQQLRTSVVCREHVARRRLLTAEPATHTPAPGRRNIHACNRYRIRGHPLRMCARARARAVTVYVYSRACTRTRSQGMSRVARVAGRLCSCVNLNLYSVPTTTVGPDVWACESA